MPGSGRRLQLVPPTGKKPAWARCGETTSAEWILFLHSTDWLDFSLLVGDAFGLILNSGLQAGGPKAPDGKKGRVGAGGSPVKPKVEEATASDGSVEDEGQKKGKGKSAKPPVEPPKDYVHVRARRGQATDSHSLAERVRHCTSTRFLPFEPCRQISCVWAGIHNRTLLLVGVLIGSKRED